MEDVTLTELIDMLSELFTNMNNLDKTYYDMFYNQTPMDITLDRYNENGDLEQFVVPNRAKDKDAIIVGNGEPENNVESYIGKLYMDLDTGNLYYKSSGSTEAPTATGWKEIYTQANAGDTFQYSDEKGQPNGYASLGADGKVPSSQLPMVTMTYYDLGIDVTIDLILKTTMTYECSNTELTFNNIWSGTDDELGTRVVVLTQDVDATYAIDTDIVTITGSPNFVQLTGNASGFSINDYYTVPAENAVIKINTGSNNTVAQTILSFDGHDIEFTPSATTVDVTCSNPDITVVSTHTGIEPEVGVTTDILTYNSSVLWNSDVCFIPDALDYSTGDVSGFTSDYYLAAQILPTSINTLKVKFTTGDDVTTPQGIVGYNTGMSLCIKDGFLGYNSAENEFVGLVEATAHTSYYMKSVFDTEAGTNIVTYSTDDITYTRITPTENNGRFIFDGYQIGIGVVEGVSNQVFLGVVNALESAVIITSTSATNYFASLHVGWYNEDNVPIELSNYLLEITSGTPEIGDVITATYTTTAPSIGTQAVTPNTDYFVRYSKNNGLFTPQISTDNSSYEDIGDAFVFKPLLPEEFNMTIGQGTFYGLVYMGDSIADKITVDVDRNYFLTGTDITDVNGNVDGFDADNYATVATPVSGTSLVIDYVLGNDVDTKQTLFSLPAATITGGGYNTLYIENGDLFISSEGIDLATNVTGLEADTTLYIRVTNSEDNYTLAYSTDNVTFDLLDAEGATDFTPIFTGPVITLGTDFTNNYSGIINMFNSYLLENDAKNYLYSLHETVVLGARLLAPLTTIYRWFDNGTQVNLATYGLELTGGTPQTGDTITITYTTIPIGQNT